MQSCVSVARARVAQERINLCAQGSPNLFSVLGRVNIARYQEHSIRARCGRLKVHLVCGSVYFYRLLAGRMLPTRARPLKLEINIENAKTFCLINC